MGREGSSFGCSLGSEPSIAIGPALGVSRLGVDTRSLGSQFLWGALCERGMHGGKLRSLCLMLLRLGPLLRKSKKEEKGLMSVFQEATCVNTVAGQGCLLLRLGWFRPAGPV